MLGEFEYLLITTAARLGENAYGAAIREGIEEIAQRKCSIGALYTTIERLEGKVGGKVTFDEVLAVRNDDKKLVSGGDVAKAKVIGKIVAQDRGPKLKVLKYKTGGQYQIQRGHRQNYTSVQVSDIQIS